MFMKYLTVILGMGLSSLLLGCSSVPVVVAPVGPNPAGVVSQTRDGQLEVYSDLIVRTEGDNPTWYQHRDYTVYDPQGKPVEHVRNTVGYYARRPSSISLPPGKYLVRAEAKDYLRVEVPVVIKSGQITRVHLDDDWRPTDAPQTVVVSLPTGNPVGWAANIK